MHTLNKYLNRALWLVAPIAIGIIFAIILNAAFGEDGIVIGHPKVKVVYINPPEDMRLQQLAAAIDMRQLQRKVK